MGTKVVIGIAVGVVLLPVVAYYAIPDPGKKALQREQTALEGVTSWRIGTEFSRNGRPVAARGHSAICPDKEHIVESAKEDFAEYIRIGDEVYYRKNTYEWVKGTPGRTCLPPCPCPGRVSPTRESRVQSRQEEPNS